MNCLYLSRTITVPNTVHDTGCFANVTIQILFCREYGIILADTAPKTLFQTKRDVNFFPFKYNDSVMLINLYLLKPFVAEFSQSSDM